jgi:hypothetical protein
MPTWSFEASAPYRAYGRWWFAIEGAARRCHGPFPSEEPALAAREALFRRWVGRARALGGEAVRLADSRWIVTLPEGVPCGGRPFVGEAIARASALPTDGSEASPGTPVESPALAR